MAFKKRRLIQAISDRVPGDDESLLAALKKEIWPFLQQVRRMILDADGSGGTPDGPGGTTVIVNEGDTTNTTVISTTINPSPFSDHLVKARTVDATSVGGLLEKTAADAPVTLGVLTDSDGIERLHIGVAQTAPEVAGSKLFTARIKDPSDMGQVVACYLGPHSKGANNPMFDGWSNPAPDIFVRNETGPIPPYWLDGVDTRCDDATIKAPSPLLGKRFLAYYQGDTSLLGTEEPKQQVFILEDAGGHWEPAPGHPDTLLFVATQARFRRAPGFTESSQYVHGMTFQVQTGNKYGAGFLTLANASSVLGVTALSWTFDPGPTHAWNYTHALLSASQLTTQNVDMANVDLTTEMAGSPSSPGVAYVYFSFPTLSGTPGTTTLAKGPQEFHFERVSLSTEDLTGTTRLLARLIITDAAGTSIVNEMLPVPSGLLTPNATVTNLVIPYTLAADIDMSVVERFALAIGISTTCATPATLSVRVNSAAHGTYWKGTFQLPTTGNPNPAWSDISPKGSDVRPLATVAIDGSGNAPLVFGVAGANFYIVTGAGPLKFLPTPPVDAGKTVEVSLVSEAPLLQLQHAAGFPPAGSSPLYLPAGTTTFKNAKSTHKLLWRSDLSAWLREGT